MSELRRRRSERGDRGPWEALRPLRRKLIAQQNHPIYVARGNEQPLLQELVSADPPSGGMEAYIIDLDRKSE